MDFGTALYWQLSNDAGVSALVDTDHIQPNQSLEDKSYPQIVYQCETTTIDRAFSGRTGLIKDQIMVHCLDTSYEGTVSLGKAAFLALDDGSGNWGAGNTESEFVAVKGVFFEDEKESTQRIGEAGQETVIYIKTLTFKVWYVLPG